MLVAGPALAQYIDAAPPPLPTAPIGTENVGDALSRNVRILAQSPRDYAALVGAGRAALATGDPEAAVGFFGRAEDASPKASAPKAGLGAALVAMGEPARALPKFDEAQRLGAPLSSFAADRGLARDLLGQQSLAQSDYRLALIGPDGSEARRRLALSLAISGDRVGAIATLAPLLQRNDMATIRTRAFILALGGDADAADRLLDSSMPGLSRSLDPFFRRLLSLSPAQKAAAVHLGVIPGSGVGNGAIAGSSVGLPASPRLAQSQSGLPDGPSLSTTSDSTQPVTGDRLSGIEDILRGPAKPAPPPVVIRPVPRTVTAAPAAIAPKRVWIQLASGASETALAGQFERLAQREPAIFAGIRPYVTNVDGRTKLLIGPFKSSEDSRIFLENLADVRIEGFSWISPEGQVVRKLANP
ncbi:SPOR domain-containing protein [Sphingomonas sp.]|uniref:SPOR domain-containing protein n=1 Tax=Sphingomonas sp. TaxID=28214 RepID=UPI00286AB686|nr:SPOR domain-containing protein [Sphingomonas sp.]